MLVEVYDWPTAGMRVSPGDLVHTFEDAFLSLDDGGTLLEISIVFDPISAGHPAVQSEGNVSISRNPFAVVAARNMQVGGI